MAKNQHHKNGEIPSHLSRLTNEPLLAAEEEIVLSKAAQTGCEESRQRLINANIRLVINIARSYPHRSIPLDDLVQEGVIGLMTAVNRFDPERGFRFSTYATHWIRQAISGALDSKSKTIRIPTHISQALRKIEKIRNEILEETAQEPTPEQIAERMGMSVKKLTAIRKNSQELISLDVHLGDDEDTTLASLIYDEKAGNPEAFILNSEIVEELQELLNVLTERERIVINYAYRQEGQKSKEDLATELQISKERVRQIEVHAIRKLRVIAQQSKFREYLEN